MTKPEEQKSEEINLDHPTDGDMKPDWEKEFDELVYKYNRGEFGNPQWDDKPKQEPVTMFAVNSVFQEEIKKLFSTALDEAHQRGVKDAKREVLNELRSIQKDNTDGDFGTFDLENFGEEVFEYIQKQRLGGGE